MAKNKNKDLTAIVQETLESHSEILRILDSLAETSKSNTKLDILAENRDSIELQLFFMYSLDKFKNYYIREATFPVVISTLTESMSSIQEFVNDFLPTLYNRELTGNAAIDALARELEKFNQKDIEVIKRILFKDPKCGVSEKIVNKIWPELVKEIPYMRCSGPDALKNLTYPAYAQKKSDGTYCNVIIGENSVFFMTRNGSEFNINSMADVILRKIELMPELKNTVLMGELLSFKDFKPEDRKTGNGKITRIIKRDSTLETAKGDKKEVLRQEFDEIDISLGIDLWDMVPYADWVKGYCSTPYNERFSRLCTVLQKVNSSKFRPITSKIVYNEEELMSFNALMMQMGEEGSVAKNISAVYKKGTSKDQMKIKAILDADLLCTGWYFGRTGSEIEEGLGGLILESSDGIINVSVGSGFSREQRGLEPIDNDDIAKGLKRTSLDFDKEYVGKIITIEYNALVNSKHSTDKYSCFLPVFIEVREDKTEADSYEKLSKQEAASGEEK